MEELWDDQKKFHVLKVLARRQRREKWRFAFRFPVEEIQCARSLHVKSSLMEIISYWTFAKI